MTSLVDLNPAHRAIVEHILAEHVPECEVRAFGSRATWNARDTSDLDLAVIGDGPLPSRILTMLKEAFEESRLPMRVDVIDWNAITDGFRESIDPDSVVVQGAAASSPWPVVRLGDCIVTNEETISSKDAWAYINYLDTGNITENRIDEIQHLVVGEDKVPVRARRKVRDGDIVYSTVRPNQRHYGLLKDIPENLLASTGFVVIRGKEGVAHTDFVYWLLAQDHIVEYLQAIAEHSTSAYPSIKPSDIEAIEFPLPPLEDQRRIAGVLSKIDAKIDLNRRMSETLEEMARALFKSWFVDFEPVRAKANDQPSGLPPDLDALFPVSFETSELGAIPAGWEVKTLGDTFRITMGQSPPSKTYNQDREGLPFYQGCTDFGFRFPRRRVYCTLCPTRFAEQGDSLVSVRAPVGGHQYGDGAVLRWTWSCCGPATSVVVVRTLITRCGRSVIPSNDLKLRGPCSEPSARKISIRCVGVSPSDSLVAQFDELCSVMDNQIEASEVVTALLVAQRNTLLPRLLSGNFRIAP